ncbi:STAS domain-containing protein [Streptomyces minutiscleroticus]|uniref:STAS domain-containing protein n=1 Tax=Streptomyces minutiscleroticus TaxID=68238 RepID=UPI0033206AEF
MSTDKTATPVPVRDARSAHLTEVISLGAGLPYPLALRTRPQAPGADTTAVVLHGEIDRQAEQVLEHALRDVLRRAPRGVELDLEDITFIDCSGLNVLLALHRWAAEQGKALTIGAAGPAADRLLTLTGTWPLFGTAHAGHARASAGAAEAGAASEVLPVLGRAV